MAPEDNNGAFIRITNREIFDQIENLKDTVHSMDMRMNAILIENVETKTRLRALELKTYTLLAGFSTALVGGIVLLLKGALG